MMIRKAIEKDIASIYRIIVQYESDYTEAMVADCFASHYQQWVIEENNKVIGVLIVTHHSEVFEIIQIGIDKKHRHQKYGSQLMQYLLREALMSCVEIIQLEVRASNCIAIAFYSAFGFKQVGIRKRFYRDGEDALLFDLNI